MPAEHPEVKSAEEQPRRKRRLKLMESYGAFSDDRLQEVADKIRDITAHKSPQPATREGLLPSPLGDSIGDSIGTPIQTPIESPIHRPIDSPNGSPNESPIHLSDRSPNRSPGESPNGFADGQTARVPVLLTENQAVLYFCLTNIAGAVTSLSRIAGETGISEHTLKSCLKKLTKEGLITYGGRRNCGGRIGFTAEAVPRSVFLRGNKTRLAKTLHQINYAALLFAGPLESSEMPIASHDSTDHRLTHLLDHRMNHPMDHPIATPPCSSSKKDLLLQRLILEDAFQDLNPRSLLPYLEQFDTTEELQRFVDIANACIAAAKDGRGKSIQNPQGFLFAQLRAGYINPPEGYRSRKVRAQERRNQQLEEELAALRQLKEREQELQFEVFKARLTAEDLARLEQEARARVKPNIGLSPERQLEAHKDDILKQWFGQQGGTS